MKLNISIRPRGEKASLRFNVDVPQKYFNIAKESAKVIAAVTSAIKNIKSSEPKEQ